MKIFSSNAVYVQKKDLDYLYSSDVAIPSLVFLGLFKDGMLYIGQNDENDFVRFDGDEASNYFKTLDWIIDYSEVYDLDKSKLDEMCYKIMLEIEELSNSYKKMTYSKKVDSNDALMKIKLLKYKYYALKDVLVYREHNIPVKLPDKVKKHSKVY